MGMRKGGGQRDTQKGEAAGLDFTQRRSKREGMVREDHVSDSGGDQGEHH